jgi:hypothetical protein
MPWHDYLALALVAAAVVLVLLRAYRFFMAKPTSGCGSGCGSCPSTSPSASRSAPLLSIGDRPQARK